jgi:CubicO group peptidase (beta-lactamase class C family)
VKAVCLLLATLLLSVNCSAAQAPDASARMDEYLDGLAAANRFSGSVLVARDGAVVTRKGYGLASVEHDVPNTPETRFRLASVTKQFTAVAILMLQEKGKLRVEDSICKYLDECPPAWQPVTVHHLVTHTSGIPSFTGLPDYRKTSALATTPLETIARVRNLPLEFAPGERFAYNNSGYVLLGLVIERASGKPYAEFLRENVFEPLGMTNTGYDTPGLVVKRHATGYLLLGEGFVVAPYINMSVPYAAGGLYSTVDDLYKWDQALYTEKLLSKKSLEAAFTPAKNGYAYGFGIGEQYGLKTISHGGGIEGFSTFIRRFPDQKATVIVLSNVQNTNSEQVAGKLARFLLGDVMSLPVAVKVDPSVLKEYAGRYQLGDTGPTTDVSVAGDGLSIKITGQPRTELMPLSPTTFFNEEMQGARFTFEKDATGKVAGFTFNGGGGPETHRKIALPPPSLKGNTEFRLKGHKHASIVTLAGAFNGWNHAQIYFGREGDDWVCRIDLAPGKYQYKFLVDGDWIQDPGNPVTEGDGHGNTNSVIVKK